MMNIFAFQEREMARVLLLESQEQPIPMPAAACGDRAPERAFVCKTCDRVSTSFQALGGHRASHEKPRLDGDGALKPKLHGCYVCGLEFDVGQALGGHMRRHRAMLAGGGGVATSPPVTTINKPVIGSKRGLWLDLNQPPCDDGGSIEADHIDCGHDAATAGYRFHQFLDTRSMAVDCVRY